MITKWDLSQNSWEYTGTLVIESKCMPILEKIEEGKCVTTTKITVDGVILAFDEDAELVEIDGKKVEKP